MLISTRSRYALRALVHMARAGNDKPLALGSISEVERISVRYLEQIFGKLRTAGIVRGKRGPGGGYVLSREPSDVSLYEIVQALETEFLPASCISESSGCAPEGSAVCSPCPLEETCVTRDLWANLRDMYFDYMREHSLLDLSEKRLWEPAAGRVREGL